METRTKIVDLFPAQSKKYLEIRGTEIMDKLGEDIIKEVIYNVLTGNNVRDSTEKLTRKRIGLISSALLVTLAKGCAKDDNFLKNLSKLAADELKTTKNKRDRWILEWFLGLTDKGFQNILRDKPEKIQNYAVQFDAETLSLVSQIEKEFGLLNGEITINTHTKSSVNWRFMVQLMGVVGAQTLAIRGSEKSTYGKLFEKLILGSTLSILGFEFQKKNKLGSKKIKNVFWLSDREDKRESDATALCELGKGVRFDIGFIGRGNPEISLDKVSRFEKAIEFNNSKYYMATFILVDRIGENSRIPTLAKRIDASIIQMSLNYWPKELAKGLKAQVGHNSEIINIDDRKLDTYLKQKIGKLDIGQFF